MMKNEIIHILITLVQVKMQQAIKDQLQSYGRCYSFPKREHNCAT